MVSNFTLYNVIRLTPIVLCINVLFFILSMYKYQIIFMNSSVKNISAVCSFGYYENWRYEYSQADVANISLEYIPSSRIAGSHGKIYVNCKTFFQWGCTMFQQGSKDIVQWYCLLKANHINILGEAWKREESTQTYRHNQRNRVERFFSFSALEQHKEEGCKSSVSKSWWKLAGRI